MQQITIHNLEVDLNGIHHLSEIYDITTNKTTLSSRGRAAAFWFASDDAITITELNVKIKDALARFLVNKLRFMLPKIS